VVSGWSDGITRWECRLPPLELGVWEEEEEEEEEEFTWRRRKLLPAVTGEASTTRCRVAQTNPSSTQP
jgi:hypothetical protein